MTALAGMLLAEFFLLLAVLRVEGRLSTPGLIRLADHADGAGGVQRHGRQARL